MFMVFPAIILETMTLGGRTYLLLGDIGICSRQKDKQPTMGVILSFIS